MKFSTMHGQSGERPARTAPSTAAAVDANGERSIGHILGDARQLSPDQIEQILAFQRQRGLRFGTAAVALGLASRDDVLRALAQQFRYPVGLDGSGLGDELVVATAPFGERAEAFRELRSQLLMGVLGAAEPRAAIAVASVDAGDGRSFVAANLALAFAQLGGRTLIVDADLRAPRQHALFGVDNAAGLAGILAGRAEDKVIRPVRNLSSLYVLPAGALPPNPLELLQQSAFAALLHELVDRFDHVVVDTAAAAHGADARVVAARCGASLAVGRRGGTTVRGLEKLVGALARGPGRFAGVVVNER